MYSVQVFTQGHSGWIATVMTLNPGNVYLTLARSAVIVGSPAPATTWLVGIAWSVGVLATSYLYFWRGEEQYGNV
jgi:teichoic acid transport system permease protein